jgi:hypothetical protein
MGEAVDNTMPGGGPAAGPVRRGPGEIYSPPSDIPCTAGIVPSRPL